MKKQLTTGLLIGLFMFGLCGIAQANMISGSLWHVIEATAQYAVPTNVPVTAADVTFEVNAPLNFSAADAAVGEWLANGPTGNFGFQRVFGESNMDSAVLQRDLPLRNIPIPEPSSKLLFGAGLVGLAGVSRRKKN